MFSELGTNILSCIRDDIKRYGIFLYLKLLVIKDGGKVGEMGLFWKMKTKDRNVFPRTDALQSVQKH